MTTPSDYKADVDALCETCRRIGDRGWCRATSGNFSTRIGEMHCLITRSGRDKSQLEAGDLMICDLNGAAVDGESRPSAETPLHCCLYRLDPRITAVLHTHSVTSTVLSRHAGEDLRIQDFEMQKAFAGVTSHEGEIRVKVFANDQDMHALAERLEDAWHAGALTVPGFLVRGHGLYAWGTSIAEAVRHLEGFEFLFDCVWQERLAGPR